MIGPVPGGLPAIGLPDVTWSEALTLLPVAASCFVMIIAQSAATSRAFALRYHERVDGNADILGLSAANAAAALSGTFVVNGSPTQTAMADRAGARSQIAQLVFAGVVVLVLLFLTGPLQYLPRCVLAAIVFTIAAGMIDMAGPARYSPRKPGRILSRHRHRRGRCRDRRRTGHPAGDRAVAVQACAPQLQPAHHHADAEHNRPLGSDAGGAGQADRTGADRLSLNSDLFYANAARFADEVRLLVKHAPTPVRWFIVDAGPITDIDYSAAQSLRDLLEELSRQGVCVIFARVSPYLRSDVDRHRITTAIGETRIFATLHEAIATVRGDVPDVHP